MRAYAEIFPRKLKILVILFPIYTSHTIQPHSNTRRGVLQHNAGLPKIRDVSGSFSLFHWVNSRREDPCIHSHRYVHLMTDRPSRARTRRLFVREIGAANEKTLRNACEVNQNLESAIHRYSVHRYKRMNEYKNSIKYNNIHIAIS